MVRLQPKLESELQKETLVVTNTFALPSWTPQQTIETEDLYRTKIHIYVNQKKAKKNQEIEYGLDQNYTMVCGKQTVA